MGIKQNVVRNLKNIPGWSISRKIIVIECDDWGGIRMPSKKVLDHLIQSGLPADTSRYNRYDTLEGKEDLEQLFDILLSVKDKNSRPAVMTPVTIVANPDFDKIKQSDFKEYHFEKFTDTILKYGRGEEVFAIWKQGINLGIFVPELHGRDHIAVQFWLRELREGNKNLLKAFNNKLVTMAVPGLHPVLREFRPEFYFDNDDQKPFLKRAIIEGSSVFKDIFGYTPNAFVPGNGIFHPDFEESVTLAGLRFLNVSHLTPIPGNEGKIKHKYFTTGGVNAAGLTYYIRNCAFEPTDEGYKGIDHTMKQIAASFRWHKPGIISTHRVNFVGGICQANRDKGLKELKMLLDTIVKKWPDVEFMSAGDALELMRDKNKF